MKKTLVSLSALVLLASWVGTSSADTLVDTTFFTNIGTDAPEDLVDYGWGSVNKLDGFSDYIVWEHQFVFDPAFEVINTGTLELYLRDDRDRWKAELGFGWTESGTWALGEVDTGWLDYDVDVRFLEDGVFRVTVASLGGDFFLDQSVLTVDYDPVPEPGTMLLFGTGLLGLAGYSRKRRKSTKKG